MSYCAILLHPHLRGIAQAPLPHPGGTRPSGGSGEPRASASVDTLLLDLASDKVVVACNGGRARDGNQLP